MKLLHLSFFSSPQPSLALPVSLLSAGLVISTVLSAPAAAVSLSQVRSLDGSGNNLLFSDYGRLGETLARQGAANYGDGYSTLVAGPNARQISNSVFAQPTSLLDENGLSDFSWAWGQFVSHDISHTLTSSWDYLTIPISAGDGVFTPGQAIPMTRSVFDPATGSSAPREQINNITPWIDGGIIYGGRASEPNGGQGRANWLRSGTGGKLLTSTINGAAYLPTAGQKALAPGMAEGSGGIDADKRFVAGDVRANEHAALTALHTLLVREHNRLVDELAVSLSGELAGLSAAEQDEFLYQAAKKIVGAQVQAVTYNEYLPTLGVKLSDYKGYDETVNPQVTNEFSTAGFRLGHSQISGVIRRVNADGTTHAAGDLSLFAGFFAPESFLETDLEAIFRGLSTTVQQRTDAKISDDLRNLLFGPPSAGPFLNGTDLAALNIQRGRDHGLASYRDTRLAYGLADITSFAEITDDLEVQAALAEVYGSVDRLDLWVGMLAERHLSGASVGELAQAILADQFERLRDGDSFWYANDGDFRADGLLAQLGYDQAYFDSFSLGQLIASNSAIAPGSLGRQGNVFWAAPLKSAQTRAQSVPEPSALFGLLGLVALLAWVGRAQGHPQDCKIPELM